MCWATVGSVLIDQFVLKGRLFPFRHLNFIPFDQFFLTFFIPFIAIWWVLTVYWK